MDDVKEFLSAPLALFDAEYTVVTATKWGLLAYGMVGGWILSVLNANRRGASLDLLGGAK